MVEKFFVAVKGLVIFQNKVLIVRRSRQNAEDCGVWELPGGRLEFGETPEQTVIREVFEETGLAVECIAPLGIWNFFRDACTEVIGITCLCRTQDERVRLSEEHDAFRWIHYKDITKSELAPAILENMRKWDWEWLDFIIATG